jgi:predicted enzyme related to lactoylglutathione lyase
MEYKLNSVYVSVKDMDRATKFYENLFGREADKNDPRYSEFQFENITFGLYSPDFDGAKITWGENCVVNFEISDAQVEYDRIKEFALEIDDEIMDLPQMYLFQFKDTEGNILEVYSWKK